MGKENITEINPDYFWKLIEEMKEYCGQDMERSAQWIMNRLCKLPPEQVLQFHLILQGYKEAANKYGLWTVAGLIKDTGCSDDGFIDFRAWLIAQGKDVYMAALENPDSLSDIKQYGSCEFESFNYVASKAYEELTGRDAYRDYTDAEMKRVQKELLQGIHYHPMIEYPLNPPEAAVVYPKAGERFAQKYDINNPAFASVWNTSLPELKKLAEEGKREAHKYQKDRQRMGKKKKRRREHGGMER